MEEIDKKTLMYITKCKQIMEWYLIIIKTQQSI